MVSVMAMFPAWAGEGITVVPKGDFSVGAQFANLRLDSDNSEIMLLLNPVSAEGRFFQFAPFFEYAYKENSTFGARLHLTNATAVLDQVTIDLLNEGLSFDITDLDTRMKSYGASVFHRNYFGLDPRGRVAVISELALTVSGGRTDYDFRNPGSDYSTSRKLNFSFSPGLVFYVMNNVSAMCTISMANISYNRVKCFSSGAETGSREKFASRFGVDLTGINFGIAFHF